MDTFTKLILVFASLAILVIGVIWIEHKQDRERRKAEDQSEKERERQLNEDYELELLEDQYQILLYLKDDAIVRLKPLRPTIETYYNEQKIIVSSDSRCKGAIYQALKNGYFMTDNGSFLLTHAISWIEVVKSKKEE